MPTKLSINIDLSKIKIKKIFKWLKQKKISDNEMLNTFNCGVGFCIIVEKKNISKIKRYFSKRIPTLQNWIYFKNWKKVNLFNSLKW